MMKNKRIKCLLIIILSVLYLLSETFAAIVADNDGSVFVTKAEFENLKNNFNSQINQYNQSIDQRIDGSISSYIAGVKVQDEPVNLYENYYNLTGKKPVFLNQMQGTGSDTSIGAVNIKVNREQAVNKFTNLYFATSLWTDGGSRHTGDAALYFNSAPNWDNGYNTWKTVWQIKQHDFSGAVEARQIEGSLSAWSYWSSSTTRTNAISSYNAVADSTVAGSGSAYLFQSLNNGRFLKFYDSSIYPKLDIVCDAHRYKNCAALTASYYTSDGGKGDTTDITLTLDAMANYGNTTVGTKQDAKSTTNGTYAAISLSKAEVNNGLNYMDYILANGTDSLVYCIDEDAEPVTSSTSRSEVTTDTTYFYDIYYTGSGAHPQKNSMSRVKLQYYPLKFNVNQYKINSFYNYYVSSVAGERVYNGEGFPIVRAQSSDSDVEMKIKFVSNGGNILYRISDKKFIDGAFDPSANIKIEDIVASGTTVTKTVEGIGLEKMVWVNCYAVTAGNTATIDDFSVKSK